MPLVHRTLFALVLVGAACDDKKDTESTAAAPAGPKYEPMMTKELVPPAAKGLALGIATEKDVAAAFGVAEVVKDKSLGGAAKVEYAGKPAIMIELAPKEGLVQGNAWLMGGGDGEPKLARVELVLQTTDTCTWVKDNIGKHEASKKRPGGGLVRRKYGEGEYTAGNSDGTMPVGIECRASKRDDTAVEVLEYRLEPEGSVSMLVSRE